MPVCQEQHTAFMSPEKTLSHSSPQCAHTQLTVTLRSNLSVVWREELGGLAGMGDGG